MRTIRTAMAALLLCAASMAAYAQGDLLPLPPEQPIRGMNTPALSPDGKTVCFSYLGDLWTVPATGGNACSVSHSAAAAAPAREHSRLISPRCSSPDVK